MATASFDIRAGSSGAPDFPGFGCPSLLCRLPTPVAILFVLLSISCSLANANEPTDEQLDDWVNYLRSVGIPSTVKICGTAIDDEARFKAAADAWSVANQVSVDRGRALASANPPKGWKSLDAYNESMVKDYEAKLTSLPAMDQLETCVKYVELLEKRASGR